VSEIGIASAWRTKLEAVAGSRGDLASVAIAIVLIAVMSLVLWTRRAPARIAPPALARPTAPSVSIAGVLYVHVAGAVAAPGLYELAPGSRVADAIAAAGGPLRGADLDALNLAQPLTDGAKVDVPRRASGAVSTATAGSPVATPGLVSLNSADQATLETVPGIGPVTATAIIRFREENGGFTAMEDLLDISGIGPATVEAIRPYVTL